MSDVYKDRLKAIRQYLEGEKPSQIYTSLGYSQTWFFKWKLRYEVDGLDGLRDRSTAPHHQATQTAPLLEQVIVNIRKQRERRERDETKYALIGAPAIRRELLALGYNPPATRTIHQILVRHGLITAELAPSPPREVIDRHYPAVTITRPGQLQQLDVVGPRYLKGSSQKYSFYHIRDVCSRRVALEVGTNHQALTIVKALIQSWQRMGLPTILQHDNAMEFRGSTLAPRTAGLLTRFCLKLGIESLFIPTREPWRNGAIENFNGLFQRFVLLPHHITTYPRLQQEVRAFEVAANTQHGHKPLNGQTSEEYEQTVHYQPRLLPQDFAFDSGFHFDKLPEGNVSFICRIRKSGKITIASEKFFIDPELAWDYVYATIVVNKQVLQIYHKGEAIKEFPYRFKT